MASQQQAVNTASASLDLARKSYQAGNSGLLQVQDAARQFAQAQLGLVRAQRQRYLDTAQLFVALGGSPLTESSEQVSRALTEVSYLQMVESVYSGLPKSEMLIQGRVQCRSSAR